jgi:quinohemoprotein ethanol dehydrogenase
MRSPLVLRWGVVALCVMVAASDRGMSAQSPSPASAGAKGDWPLHSLDLYSGRFSALDEINTSNVGTLAQKWSFDAGSALGQLTPLVIDGIMYFNSGSKVFAVNGATGERLWTTEIQPAFGPTGRGPAYGDGRIYAYGATTLFAVDAKTGKPIESFGSKGTLQIVNKMLDFAYPGKYEQNVDPVSLGYFSLTTPPAYYRGTLYFGLSHGDSHIPGGLLAAVDGTTGAIKWTFNPVPQVPTDEGWQLAKDTWKGGARVGAGIWTQPAIDPELGMIYFNASNPSPDFDGSARVGNNLFTNSTIALHLATGKLAWHFQTIHHDVWDWDLVSGPLLFDAQVGGRTVKAIGAPGKTCFLYVWNRETGQPVNPMVETPVPTFTDVPGEHVSPTQPIPYTARGVPQQPFCMQYPIVTDPELAKRVRPFFHPYLSKEFVITAPGNTGGANFGPPSFSPRTGLVYVTGKNDAFSIKVKPVGDSIRAGKPAIGFSDNIAERGPLGMKPSQTVAAYNPGTGDLIWYVEIPATTNSGNVVTAGDLVFQGVAGDLYAFDARSGNQLLKAPLRGNSRASPITYSASGRQYVAIAAATTVVAFALP